MLLSLNMSPTIEEAVAEAEAAEQAKAEAEEAAQKKAVEPLDLAARATEAESNEINFQTANIRLITEAFEKIEIKFLMKEHYDIDKGHIFNTNEGYVRAKLAGIYKYAKRLEIKSITLVPNTNEDPYVDHSMYCTIMAEPIKYSEARSFEIIFGYEGDITSPQVYLCNPEQDRQLRKPETITKKEKEYLDENYYEDSNCRFICRPYICKAVFLESIRECIEYEGSILQIYRKERDERISAAEKERREAKAEARVAQGVALARAIAEEARAIAEEAEAEAVEATEALAEAGAKAAEARAIAAEAKAKAEAKAAEAKAKAGAKAAEAKAEAEAKAAEAKAEAEAKAAEARAIAAEAEAAAEEAEAEAAEARAIAAKAEAKAAEARAKAKAEAKAAEARAIAAEAKAEARAAEASAIVEQKRALEERAIAAEKERYEAEKERDEAKIKGLEQANRYLGARMEAMENRFGEMQASPISGVPSRSPTRTNSLVDSVSSSPAGFSIIS